MKNFFFLFFLLFSFSLYSQSNLVPNPSFEVYDTCPDSYNQLSRAYPWIPLSRTPDYFNKCALGTALEIPYNYIGFKWPKLISDSGYANIYISFNSGREIIGCSLNDTLTIGEKYYVSMDISPVLSNIIKCFYNKIGLKFFTHALTPSNGLGLDLINNFSQVYSDQLVTDTSSWTKLNFSFTSDSSYVFVAIGVFFQDSLLTSYCPNQIGPAIYFVDNICVSTDSNYCVNNSSIINDIKDNKIQFSYTQDYLEFIFNSTSEYENCIVFNNLGQIVYDNKVISGQRIDISQLISSIYYIIINNLSFKFIKL